MFESFFFAGFESGYGRNAGKEPFDQIEATQHDLQLEADYARIAGRGLRAARDAVVWPKVDRGGTLDLRPVVRLARAAEAHGVTPVYDLFHFGYPEDLDVFSGEFIRRFARYCRAVARTVREHAPEPHCFTPVNEPSYLAWAAGDQGLFPPYARGRGAELKLQLARATIAGIEAIREECPSSVIVNVDPLCRAVSARSPGTAEQFNRESVFESWDMLAGRLRPELGGSPAHLGVVGLNYYATNQWELELPAIPLPCDDPRRVPLRELIAGVADRYDAPLLLSETSGVGEGRAPWIEMIAAETVACLEAGVPLRGVCLYPVLSMPEWHRRDCWTPMGLWDLASDGTHLRRVPHPPAMEALRLAERRVREALAASSAVDAVFRT